MLFLVASALVTLTVCLLYLYWPRPQLSAEDPSPEPKAPSHFHLDFYQRHKFLPDLTFSAQSLAWQQALQAVGQTLAMREVGYLVCVHGTFVGEDPFDMMSLMTQAMPSASHPLLRRLQGVLKRQAHGLFGDAGIFSPAYMALLQEAFPFKVDHFSWSSGNHHTARLLGAAELLKALTKKPHSRILLYGHSHAGQLFALLTQFINHPELRPTFIDILTSLNAPTEDFLWQCQQLETTPIDFVTLGAPPRYHYHLSSQHTLLHLINHRGPSLRAGTSKGALYTRDGDYIQQWGVDGSDSISLPFAATNKQLNDILGIGSDIMVWRQTLKKRQRLHKQGINLLIDYKDQGNAMKTLFGHAVYTRYHTLLFNFEVISRFLSNP
jgi:hypothetical protein